MKFVWVIVLLLALGACSDGSPNRVPDEPVARLYLINALNGNYAYLDCLSLEYHEESDEYECEDYGIHDTLIIPKDNVEVVEYND